MNEKISFLILQSVNFITKHQICVKHFGVMIGIPPLYIGIPMFILSPVLTN